MFPHPLKKVCLFMRLRLCECVINPRRCWEWPVWVDQCPSGSGIISLDLLTVITAQVLTRQHSSTAVVSACHISFSLYVSKTVSAIQVPLSLNLCQQQLVNWTTFVIKRHVRGTILQIPDRLQPLVHLITTVIRENILHFNEQMLAYRFAFNPNIYM